MAAVHPGPGHAHRIGDAQERFGATTSIEESLDNAQAGSVERPCRTFTPQRTSSCQQVVSSDPTRRLALHHGALSLNLAEQG
jgi:hypothetical protein